MYQVVTDDEVNARVAAMPDDLLAHYAQVLDLLEIAPWSSEPYTDAKPDRSRGLASLMAAGRARRLGPDPA